MSEPVSAETRRLLQIIDRLKAATGPDRELDALIMVAIGGARQIDATTFYGPHEAVWSFGEREQESGAWNGPLPYLTAFIDAAMTLVEAHFPGAGFGVLTSPKQAAHPAQAYVQGSEYAVGSGQWKTAATAPLAVLVALLEALDNAE